ncbi:MAG: ABC transporter permease [Anaerolineales bacterium]|nr:ABC transporter permease [Anaerolineales bacterium]
MNWRAMWAIVRKDVATPLRTKAVAMPLIIVPLILMVGVPASLGSVVILAQRMGVTTGDVQELNSAIPASVRESLAGLDDAQAGLVFALVYLFAPMYLILPLMVSSVIAADSFAGEKERRTFEALAYTPTTDHELLAAKMIGGWLPGLMVSFVGFFVYTLMCNLVALQVVGGPILPNQFWLILAFWVAPAAAGLGLGVTVLVSSRVNTFQEAYQLGSLIVLPVVFLMIGQIAGMFYISTNLVFAFGLVLWLLDAAIFAIGAATFKRTEMMARL